MLDILMFCNSYSFIGSDSGGLLLPVNYCNAVTEQDVFVGIVINIVTPFFILDHF